MKRSCPAAKRAVKNIFILAGGVQYGSGVSDSQSESLFVSETTLKRVGTRRCGGVVEAVPPAVLFVLASLNAPRI